MKTLGFSVVRVMGIEPTLLAWEGRDFKTCIHWYQRIIGVAIFLLSRHLSRYFLRFLKLFLNFFSSVINDIVGCVCVDVCRGLNV